MFFGVRNAGGRVIGPPTVRAGGPKLRGDRGISPYPALTVGVEESAKFLRRAGLRCAGRRSIGLRGGRSRVSVWLLRILSLAKSEQRQDEHRAAGCNREPCDDTDHYDFLPAAAASSLSRSRVSIAPATAIASVTMEFSRRWPALV